MELVGFLGGDRKALNDDDLHSFTCCVVSLVAVIIVRGGVGWVERLTGWCGRLGGGC